jgi:hypothetical protein
MKEEWIEIILGFLLAQDSLSNDIWTKKIGAYQLERFPHNQTIDFIQSL